VVTARRHLAEPERSGRTGRIVRRVIIVAVVLVVLGYAAVGWYVSGEIIDGGLVVEASTIEYDTDVLAVSDAEIRVRPPADEAAVEADRDAVMGLRWKGGYAQVGPATVAGDGTETRSFLLLDGEPPPTGEEVADFDSFAFPGDPSNLGLDFETATYPAPLGDMEAWYLPGEGSTWIVGVHGLGSHPREFLRVMDTIDDLVYPFLAIYYRNDPGMPSAGGMRFLAGQEEWEDVEAAVDFAVSQGAEDVILYAPSGGGAMSLSYAMRAPQDRIRALILEAPLADFREVVRLRSGEAIPVGGFIGDSILAVGRAFVSLRTGLDFDEVDYVDRADELRMPILLWHGSEDGRIPFESTSALSEARPDLVEYHPLVGAAHVRAWNEDPRRYEEVLKAFLDRVGRSD
jgi:uncharacterized protein